MMCNVLYRYAAQLHGVKLKLKHALALKFSIQMMEKKRCRIESAPPSLIVQMIARTTGRVINKLPDLSGKPYGVKYLCICNLLVLNLKKYFTDSPNDLSLMKYPSLRVALLLFK